MGSLGGGNDGGERPDLREAAGRPEYEDEEGIPDHVSLEAGAAAYSGTESSSQVQAKKQEICTAEAFGKNGMGPVKASNVRGIVPAGLHHVGGVIYYLNIRKKGI